MMKLRKCVETWVSQENGHFSLNNGSNSSWIRNLYLSVDVYNFFYTFLTKNSDYNLFIIN